MNKKYSAIRQDVVSPDDFNNKHDTGIKSSSNDDDLGNKLKLNNDVNQKAGSAYSLTVPFYNIQLSKLGVWYPAQ